MTDFEFFIACLPEWDSKDRVTELEKLVKAEIKIFYTKIGFTQYPYAWPRILIKKILQGVTDIFFIGEQGIEKSTLISYLFPFEYVKTEARLIANCVSVHDVEFMPNLPADYSESLICYIGDIDYSYTEIDVKQLYAQVLKNK